MLPPLESVTSGVRALRCGTYIELEPQVVAREAELANVPFLETVLGDADPCAELPVVVILHGLGDHPIVPRWPYRDLPVAVRVVVPRGPIRWGRGFAWTSVRVLDNEEAGLVATLGAQADRIGALLDALDRAFPTPRGVVLVGFSQGGHLALATAMQHPEHVALLVPLAGFVPEALRTSAGSQAPPIRWLHGTDDERIPFSMAVDAVCDLRARGYDIELIAYEGERHHMSAAMEARLHGWLAQALTNLASGRPPAEGFVLEP